ncbi:hypothetical protein HN011_012357 [Eciton burchellii]|nr:hypothetical protein HN011_012357 [Eciton burchellii]
MYKYYIKWHLDSIQVVDPLELITLRNDKIDWRTTAAISQGFRCLRCGRCYKFKRSLRRHVKVECGKTPKHKCPYCQHRSKYRASISKHVLSIHPNLPYP